MTKIVLDSDGLIKLIKAGCYHKLFKHFACSITKEVYEETVIRGMERMYDDAFQIEELIKKGLLNIEKTKNNQQARRILKNTSVGKGESSSLHLFLNANAMVIISNDRAFLNLLEQNNIPFIIPADLIVRLYELNMISKDEATDALFQIKPYVNKNSYNNAKANLED
ncbi:MAG: hypothetical protein OIN89_03410 [Candidatus Methanoperedens sp.]|jgi:predicted nucleic acid-binding protein|nr:hypothetical protein [Candidatus Methanoperedens sp.]PKL54154.1 MAG: hypothetical protein CVV36_03340 [Candidatus Methanoperedenaceae archaeon HGW-Methanoperedenaceae-1]